MAATLVGSGSKGWDTASVTTFTTTAVTPGANCALALLIYGVPDVNGVVDLFGAGMTVTSSGTGPAWTSKAHGSQVHAFDAIAAVLTANIGGTDPGSFTITFDFPGTSDPMGQFAWFLYKGPAGSTFSGAVANTRATGTGKGPQSITLAATPAASDIVLALSGADVGAASDAVFDNTARTWTRDATGGTSGHQIAYAAGQSTGSTSTTVAWSQVNEDTSDNFSSAQTAIIMTPGTASATDLVIADLTSAAALDAPTLSAGSSLAIADLTSAATVNALALTQLHQLAVANLTSATTLGAITFPGDTLYPATKSGRKLYDQNGNPIQLRSMSSWGLVELNDNTTITARLEEAAARGFNCLPVVVDGSNDYGSGWTKWENAVTGEGFYTGTPFASTLGPAWADHVAHFMDETARLGMYVLVSNYTGNGSVGSKAAMVAAGTTNCRTTGQRWATFLADWDHWILHIGADDTSDAAAETEAFCHGILDVRPGTIIVAEPNQGSDALAQWPPGDFTYFHPIEALYNYNANSVELFDTTYNGDPSTGPVWDCEPLYVGHASTRQEIRYRHYTVPIRGGVGVNNGHEDWWRFGASGVGFSAGDTAATAMDNDSIVDMQHGWTIWDLCNTAAWGPTSSFVTTGLGTGTSKAAAGTDGVRAIAYFPDNRTVVVDTTILTGAGNVRLRWYDPTDGTYTTIAASEAQSSARSVTIPAAHTDGSRDFVLVADLLEIDLTIADLTSAGTLDAANVTTITTLAVAGLTSAAALDAANVTTITTLAVAGLTSAAALDAANVTTITTLAVANLTSAATLAAPAITTTTALVIADLASAGALDGVALTSGTVLAIADLTSTSTLDGPTLTQLHQLAVSDLSSATALDGLVLTGPTVTTLTIADLVTAAVLDPIGFGVFVVTGPLTLRVVDPALTLRIVQED